MAHLQTPPRQSSTARAKAYGLVTPSTPQHYRSKQCPDAPFLPPGFVALPSTTLRTSPRTKTLHHLQHHGDPAKPVVSTHPRTRTVTGDRGTLLQPGLPPTPAETPIQKRRREEEMRRRIEEVTSQHDSAQAPTKRRLFHLQPVLEDSTAAKSGFEIFTDPVHQDPVPSPNNPFAFDNLRDVVAAPRGLSPRKRKHAPVQQLGPHEMYYSFRGKRIARKVAPGPNGESWRDAIRPTRLFEKEIEEAEEGRRRKRRRMEQEIQEELETEEEGPSVDNEEDDTHQWD